MNSVIGTPPTVFTGLNSSIFAERSAEIAEEQELVSSNLHPDIQKLFVDLENNRTERIRRAKVTRKYRLQEIIRKYDVEADVVKRQFLADRASIREKLISELTAQWFQIHREKRAMDMCVPGIFLPPLISLKTCVNGRLWVEIT